MRATTAVVLKLCAVSRGDVVSLQPFGAAELRRIPSGFRYATLVSVFHRTNGVADGCYRRVIAVAA